MQLAINKWGFPANPVYKQLGLKMLSSEMDRAECDEADFLYVFSDPSFDVFKGEGRRF